MGDITPENLVRTRGSQAQESNIAAATTLYNIIKTTLGPKGMDKIIVDQTGKVIITNDGVTILTEMSIDHPVAKMIVEVSKTQEEEIGDGTTTVVMLAGKLLENAGNLIKKGIHPTTIIKGYKLAYNECIKYLDELSINEINDDILKKLSMTAMTGKGAEENKEYLSEIIVDAVNKAESEDSIKIERVKGKGIENSELINGMVIPNPILLDSMPKEIKDAKIALIDFDLQIKKPEIDTHVSIESPEQLEKFLDSDKRKLKEISDKIIKSGANVVLCQQGIDEQIQHELSKNKIMACRRIAKFDIEHLELATGGKIISILDEIKKENLGEAGLVNEEKSKEGSFLYLRECKSSKAVCILLYATTTHILDELKRAVSDGLGDVLSVYKNKQVVPGGGAIEIELSRRLKLYSKTLNGREQLAIEEFANALESIPESLSENAGLDSINILTELKAKHEDMEVSNSTNIGLNLFNNKIEDTFKAGIIEPLKIKSQAISSAMEISTTILRVDDLLVKNAQQN